LQVDSSDGKQFLRGIDNIPEALKSTLVVVSNTPDITAPVLQNIAVSPSSADTRTAVVSVIANMTIADDLSGLQEAEWSRAGAIALRSPSGKEFLWSEFTLADRISGNSTNGTYQVQFELPQYSEEGTWTIDYIELVDKNYNTRFLIPANLTAQQLAATTIQVQGWPRIWEQQSFASATSAKGNATIQLSNLTHTYNGTEKVPTVATTPGNLTQNVTLTYNGTTTPPIDPGSYTVVAFLNDPNYRGLQVATMTISSPTPTPSPAPTIAPPPQQVQKPKKGSGNKSGSSTKKSNSGSSPKASSGSKKSSAKKFSGGSPKKSPASKSSGGSKAGGKKKKK
jgi:hypothetical protein